MGLIFGQVERLGEHNLKRGRLCSPSVAEDTKMAAVSSGTSAFKELGICRIQLTYAENE